LTLALLALVACDRAPAPAPSRLRGAQYTLVRVNGDHVRGATPFKAPPNSVAAKLDCQEHVASGVLIISTDGRTFSYRSEWRGCDGKVLVADSNEGDLAFTDGKLSLLIARGGGGSGTGQFPVTYDDTHLTVYELGGRLEFVRVPAKGR
jgi:hypothetical protein